MGYFTPVIARYLKEVACHARGRLLDVGCGSKPYKSLFPQVEAYVGMDRPSSVDQDRGDAEERKRQIDIVGGADSMPLESATFDTVLCTQVIEHLPDPSAFFREAARVLRPGGCLILTAPLMNPEHEAPFDFFRYTQYGLRELCSRHGFSVVDLKRMGGAWLAVAYLVRHHGCPVLTTTAAIG